MYKTKTNYVIVGVFVTAMLAAGLVSVTLLAGRAGPTDPYVIVLDNVADVKFGTQVRYEGYSIGQVDRILPVARESGMRFRVEVSVDQGWRIPEDSLARVGSSSFLSAKTIDIRSGESEQALPVGGVIPSAPPTDIFSAISATAAEFSDLNREQITPLLQTLNSLASQVEGDTPRITQELVRFAERLNGSLAPLERILRDENIQAIERAILHVDETAQSFATIGGTLDKTARRIDNLAANLDKLIEANKDNVDQSLKDLQYTLAAISRTIDAVVHNLDGTARNMNEFSRLIRQNPGLLLDGTPREAVSPARVSERPAAQ